MSIIKIKYHNLIYEKPLPLNYKKLSDDIKKLIHNFEKFDIKYKDEDKDEITINNEDDYNLFLKESTHLIYFKEKSSLNSTGSKSSNSLSINENYTYSSNLNYENNQLKKENKMLKARISELENENARLKNLIGNKNI